MSAPYGGKYYRIAFLFLPKEMEIDSFFVTCQFNYNDPTFTSPPNHVFGAF